MTVPAPAGGGDGVRAVLGSAQSVPAFDVPRGACDCHVHVFGPRERFPFSPERVYTPGPASLEDLQALHRALGVDRVVIVQASVYGADNRCLVDALHRLGGRARGVAVVDEAAGEDELHAMGRAGVRGARVNLQSAGRDDPAAARDALRRAAERVAPLGWHVQLYTNLTLLAALHEAVLALPVPLVVDHFGLADPAQGVTQAGFDVLLSLVRSGRGYVKLSAAHRLSRAPDHADVAPLARALIEANPQRVLWGTDWPHTGGGSGRRAAPARDGIEPFQPVDDGRGLDRLNRWAADPLQLRRILVDNPARLFGFAPV